MRFCPRCGKKDIRGDFCSRCYAEMMGPITEFKEIVIKVCPLCSKYFFRNKWVRFDSIAVVIRKITKESIKRKINVEIIPHLSHVEFRPGKTYEFEVEVRFSKTEKYFLPAKLKIEKCSKCSRSGTEYFEGIFQLRNPTKEVIDFIKEDIKRNKEKGVFITEEKHVARGIDYHITSQRYMQNLGHRLQNRFGGILKINPQLFTRNRQTSRNVYRVNVYFELLNFGIGDVVKYDEKIIKITDMGKRIVGKDIITGKNASFDYREKAEKMNVLHTLVSKAYPEIEVIEPETYQPIKVFNKKKVNAGDKVDIVIDKNKAYLVGV
ncbi:MAG: NMD3-related protein [Candidatus Woesearchaeota archaeon]|nr:NMD3-related protein [Candidatus Woesearchaeota archaeon]